MALRSLTLPLPAVIPPTSSRRSTLTQNRCYVTLRRTPTAIFHSLRMRRHVVRMAPEEERLTRRSPLDFPILYENNLKSLRARKYPNFMRRYIGSSTEKTFSEVKKSRTEWERPKPGRRPDIFPQFSPMKTPLPTPMPADPPEEDEEEDEKKEDDEEGEDNPDKENPGIPEE